MRPLKILVVDDFVGFREVVCLTLQQRLDFNIVGEASDGLEAVQQAQKLQPDLVLLDIGLPKLNGIEAGRRIRKLAPNSKILFFSQESCLEVVLEALRLGASGYLLKSDAADELLIAVDAVRQGRQFVSSHLRSQVFVDIHDEDVTSGPRAEKPPAPASGRIHELASYTDDASFVEDFALFIESALKNGSVAVVIVSESHQTSLFETLHAHGWDIAAAIQQGNYISLNMSDALSNLMVDGRIDPARCFSAADDLIKVAKASNGEHARVAACGEMATVLWARGELEAALQLEHVWDEITRTRDIDTLCGYLFTGPLSQKKNSEIFQQICAEHSSIHSY